MSQPIQIPSVSFWEALGAGILALLGFILRTERLRGRVSAHEEGCNKRQEELREHLKAIREALDARATEARDYQDRTANALQTITNRVAYMSAKLDMPLSDTGRFKS